MHIAYSGEFFVRKYEPNSASEENSDDIDYIAPSHSMLRAPYATDEETDVEDVSDQGESPLEPPDLSISPPQTPGSGATLSPNTSRKKRGRSWFRRNDINGPKEGSRSVDPKDYELVIDNDSGTYRPKVEFLPLLRAFLAANLVSLHVTTLSCMDDEYQELKAARRDERKKGPPKQSGETAETEAKDEAKGEAKADTAPDAKVGANTATNRD
jgi:hypothetical protein